MEFEEKFNRMFHKKNIDDKMLEDIRNMFPDEKEIEELLVKLDEFEKDKLNDMEIQKQSEIEFNQIIKMISERYSQRTYETNKNDTKKSIPDSSNEKKYSKKNKNKVNTKNEKSDKKINKSEKPKENKSPDKKNIADKEKIKIKLKIILMMIWMIMK